MEDGVFPKSACLGLSIRETVQVLHRTTRKNNLKAAFSNSDSKVLLRRGDASSISVD